MVRNDRLIRCFKLECETPVDRQWTCRWSSDASDRAPFPSAPTGISMRRLGLLGAILVLLAAGSAQAGSPYPPSSVITGISWDRASYVFAGVGGDIWPITWAADGSLRAAYGDGQIGCPVKVSYGTVAITSNAPSLALQGVGCGPTGSGHGKIMALGAAGSVLFGRMGQQSQEAPYPIVRSTDGGRSWQKPGWSPVFATAAFVQFGKGNEGAPDGYVYVISVTNGTTVQLTRFPPDKWNVSSACISAAPPPSPPGAAGWVPESRSSTT